jgi:predicted component of type VI protein secretion system
MAEGSTDKKRFSAWISAAALEKLEALSKPLRQSTGELVNLAVEELADLTPEEIFQRMSHREQQDRKKTVPAKRR